MKLEKALEIVIDLAHENGHNLMGWDPELDNPELEDEAKRQVEAMKMCEALQAVVRSVMDLQTIVFSVHDRHDLSIRGG